jgi:hypothetical protein
MSPRLQRLTTPLHCVLLALTWTALASPLPAFSDDTQCAEVLRGGVFNTTRLIDDTASSLSYRSWQCSTEFSSHDQAVAAGLTVGFPIYGIPLKVGATFSNSEVKTWKTANCSQADLKVDRSRATLSLLQVASPEILNAWVACMALNSPPSAVACRIDRSGQNIVFTTHWQRTAGDTAVPKVKYYSAFDSKCTRSLKQGDSIDEGGQSVPCTFSAGTAPSFVLNTSRGSCFTALTIPKEREYLSGRVVLTSARHIQRDEVVIEEDAVIITNGHQFTIETQILEVKGSPRIVSFEAISTPQAGYNGRSAAPITIVARQFKGTSLLIDNHGESGVDGANGANGKRGPKGSQGRQHSWSLWKGCHGRTESSPGGAGTDAGDGTDGGRAGDGGHVSVRVCGISDSDPIERIKVLTTAGGQRGKGGTAGTGGPGGPGGDAVPGTLQCGGGPPGPPGPNGKDGRPGKTPDRDGTAGRVFRDNC